MGRVGLLAGSSLVAALGCAQSAKVDLEAERGAIRELDGQFGALAAKKDSVRAAALYADDAVIMPPNAPAVKGGAAILALWGSLVKTPGVVLHVEPERIDVSANGEFASDMGTVTMELDGPQGRVKDVQKYLEVWQKRDGKWRVLYDTWNSNAAPPAEPKPTS